MPQKTYLVYCGERLVGVAVPKPDAETYEEFVNDLYDQASELAGPAPNGELVGYEVRGEPGNQTIHVSNGLEALAKVMRRKFEEESLRLKQEGVPPMTLEEAIQIIDDYNRNAQ